MTLAKGRVPIVFFLLKNLCPASVPFVPKKRTPISDALNCLLIGALVACATFVPIAAQSDGTSRYDKPPKNILDVMHAPSPPMPVVSPTYDSILLVSWQD